MRAAVLRETGKPLVIEEVVPGPVGSHEVRVHVDASGVCHSDLKKAAGQVSVWLPSILGHEGAGTVLEVGSEITVVRPGDTVITSFAPACGTCWFCVRDQTNLCEGVKDPGAGIKAVSQDDEGVRAMAGLGTFAEEMIVQESQVVRVDTDIPAEQLALIGCGITTGLGAAINTARVQPGASVAVFGCGGVGQSIIQGARLAGAARIVAVDPVSFKRNVALTYGATEGVDPAQGDPIAQVRELTGGRGADYTFEAAGRPDVIVQAYGAARRGGTVVVAGMPTSGATFSLPADLFKAEKALIGSFYGSAQVRRDFPRWVALIESGRLDLAGMITRRIKLEEINDAFHAMEDGAVIRSVIVGS